MSINPFTELPDELLSEIIKFAGSSEGNTSIQALRSTDKRLAHFAIQWFDEANREIGRLYPPLANMEKQGRVSHIPPMQLFQRLFERLRDEEERLLGHKDSPSQEVTPENRLKWQCDIFRSLAAKVSEETEKRKKKDFKTLVRIVTFSPIMKQRLGIQPQELDTEEGSRKIWERFLGNSGGWDQFATKCRQKSDSHLLFFLPEEIGQWTNLESIFIIGHSLHHLPSEIGNLLHLKLLFLEESQLEILPEEVGKLKDLTKLVLPGNRLKTLPLSLKQLENLQKLDVSKNPLEGLPPGLEEIQTLREIVINKDVPIPPEIQNNPQIQITLV